MHPSQKSFDYPKGHKPTRIDTEFENIIRLHPLMYGQPWTQFAVQAKERRPRGQGVAGACDIGSTFVDNGIIRSEAGDIRFQCVHIRELEDVNHHDNLVIPGDQQC